MGRDEDMSLGVCCSGRADESQAGRPS
jgi:hypothetical protein